ncbi:MAG: hypothetical protein HY812_17720, partial [Planctomycetes bacterium]|nr:hypothetical protein [Planctomycetota bacterium]
MTLDETRIPCPIAADLALDRAAAAGPFLVVDAGEAAPDAPGLAAGAVARARASLAERGRLVIAGARAASARELAALREGLWPALHVARVYRFARGNAIERTDARGAQALAGAGAADSSGYVVAAFFREHALSPAATAEKFDAAASGWNGDPSSPAYGHYRWMRRLLAVLGRPRPGERVLDAGAGAGWVGLEAALLGGRLSSFDPSAEMVRLVRQNAALLGVEVDA